MNAGLLVKLRPTGPWRIGPDSGARNRVDAVYHSDSLYAAVCSAMARLGLFEEWLDATARHEAPAVAFSSCFPFLGDARFVAPPRTLWPPTSPALLSARVRWKAAKFVPLSAVEALLAGQPLDENQWNVDGPSECLLPADVQGGPFRTGIRWNAAVDRLSGASERHSTACMEFRPGAGLWTAVAFADDAGREKWMEPVKAAFRWLADAGFGGERSRGWGRAESPEFTEGSLPELVLNPPKRDEPPASSDDNLALRDDAPIQSPDREGAVEFESTPTAAPLPPPPASDAPRPHWLLSLFTPATADAIDWSRGNYTLLERTGRIDGSGQLKKHLQMVSEGSVVYTQSLPRGAALDVAPDGSAHPVYRAGFAVAIPLPEAV
jgi:CRISPR type III-A-associated RAMP protein Csm4